MSAAEDYCDLCDLPRSTCVHGMPPPPPPSAAPPKASPVRRSSTRASGSGTSRAPAAPARAVRHRWTPPDSFRAPILAVLQDVGGELDADDLFTALEERLGDDLREADHDKTPEGELRWRYAARRARQALVAEGLMARGRPGVWELTDAGRRA